ncbi:MAG: hypothetical protein OXI15_02170 [Chromatiales bacterium]|nr:hypothetical protein [Chromatiales bacterium]
METMETITPWLTPALVLALFAWLKHDLRDFRAEFQDFRKEMTREIGDLRERMAKLEGTLEGFVAGRRDRDAPV